MIRLVIWVRTLCYFSWVTLYAVLGLAAAGLEAAFFGMLRLGNLKTQVVEYILLAFGAFILYLISVFVATRIEPSRRLSGWIFLAGLMFRATLFPLYPSLSEDLLRYRWEGKAQAAGINVYRVAPIDPEARAVRDETWPAVNGKTFTAVYGPITELAFRGAWYVACLAPTSVGTVLLMKLPSLLFDLGVAVLLILLLQRLGQPATRVVVYWWSPLTVVEFAASGHNDSIALFFLMAALLAAQASRVQLSLTALAASALSKLFAVFLAPVLLAREWPRLPGRALLWPLLLAAVAYFPFRDANVISGVAAFSGAWRNNDSLFAVIHALTGSLSSAFRIYMAIVAGTALYLAARRTPLLRATYLVLGTLLAFSANCFPWYLTWLLPLLAIELKLAWLLLTGTSVLAYHILIPYGTLGLWQESGIFRALEYIPFYALLIGRWLWRKYAH